jgi:hypothetical protein
MREKKSEVKRHSQEAQNGKDRSERDAKDETDTACEQRKLLLLVVRK